MFEITWSALVWSGEPDYRGWWTIYDVI